MAHWTTHTKYTFHTETENLRNLSVDELAFHIESRTGLNVMVSEYSGSWNSQITQCLKVEHIASASDSDNGNWAFVLLNDVIKSITGNNCLMPAREKIEIFCECS